jgi:hypothetical protein
MKIYDNIETLPLANYRRLVTSNDLSHLVIKLSWLDKLRPKKTRLKLYEAWSNIQIQIYEVMLKDKDFVNSLEEERRFALRQIKAIESKHNFERLLARVERENKEAEKANAKGYDLYSSIVYLEKYLHFAIDEDKMTLKKYLEHLHLLKLENRSTFANNQQPDKTRK